MVLKNKTTGQYAVITRTSKGGMRIYTTEDKSKATRIYTNEIFDLLEKLDDYIAELVNDD